jgi:hypothetical protein
MHPIIDNCNFESRDDEIGKAVHAANRFARLHRKIAADSGLIAALDDLEGTLGLYADRDDVESAQRCASTETAVAAAYLHAKELAEAAS